MPPRISTTFRTAYLSRNILDSKSRVFNGLPWSTREFELQKFEMQIMKCETYMQLQTLCVKLFAQTKAQQSVYESMPGHGQFRSALSRPHLAYLWHDRYYPLPQRF